MILLMNIVLFSFFQEATGASVASVIQRESLVRKMHFPRLVIPLSTILTAAMNLALNVGAVLVFMLIYGLRPRLTWLLLPGIVVFLMVLASGFAMILSALYVRYRDVAPIWGVVSQALFYASPIFYVSDGVSGGPAGRLHGSLLHAYLCNPIAAVLTQARHWMIDPHAPSVVTAIGGYGRLMIPIGITIGLCALGYWVFTREAPRIAEEL
jgi:ABC-2 type transport system permease protein